MRIAYLLKIAVLAVLTSAGTALAQSPPPRAQTTYDLVIFRPIPPCRLFDTRSKTPIATNAARTFAVTPTTSIAAQGGAAGGCPIPDSATAVQLTLTTSGAISGGYALAYPAGEPRPTIVGTAFSGSGLASATSSVPVGTEGSGAGKLVVFSTKQTNVIGDVTGYYQPRIWAKLASGAGIISATTPVISTQKLGVGWYEAKINRNVVGCAVTATADTPYYAPGYIVTSTVYENRMALFIRTDAGQFVDQGVSFEILCR